MTLTQQTKDSTTAPMSRVTKYATAGLMMGLMSLSAPSALAAGEGKSRLSDKPTPYLADELPRRTPPLLEIGDAFLGNGNLGAGFELPTGAFWQPRLWVYGNFRTAFQTFDSGDAERETEWANRLDLFANLQLTGTERLLVGISALREDNDYTGYSFSGADEGKDNSVNADIRTLFFEGDLGEIFPTLDTEDSLGFDLGFSVGRQPLFFQEGMLINDTIDAVGLTQNSIRFPGISNLRITGLWGWNDIDRDNNANDDGAHVYALLSAVDFPSHTMDIDIVYVDSDNSSLIAGGISSVQRIAGLNTSFRILGSYAVDDDDPDRADDGILAFGEVSWAPFHGDNQAYVNAFAGIDNYSSPLRDPTVGGPLGRTGITFAARGLGRYGSPLSNRSDEAFGGAVGYQMFLGGIRRQLTFEAGYRHDTDDSIGNSGAVAVRFQQALGTRVVWTVEGFGSAHEHQDYGSGARSEIQVKF